MLQIKRNNLLLELLIKTLLAQLKVVASDNRNYKIIVEEVGDRQ